MKPKLRFRIHFHFCSLVRLWKKIAENLYRGSENGVLEIRVNRKLRSHKLNLGYISICFYPNARHLRDSFVAISEERFVRPLGNDDTKASERWFVPVALARSFFIILGY